VNSPYATIEYNISQGQDKHTLTSEELAALIEDVIECLNQDRKNQTKVFCSKYTRLIKELKES